MAIFRSTSLSGPCRFGGSVIWGSLSEPARLALGLAAALVVVAGAAFFLPKDGSLSSGLKPRFLGFGASATAAALASCGSAAAGAAAFAFFLPKDGSLSSGLKPRFLGFGASAAGAAATGWGS